MILKKRIEADILGFQSTGYSKAQAASLAWAEYFEEREAVIEYRYQGNFDPGYVYDCYCRDCKVGNAFGAAGTIKLFIDEHRNHDTKTFRRSGK